ncbi:MAG: hypothetical protein H0W62_06180 [Chitinophagales bacterium]|nr:hypothetical protein [Chitinophagales bacterium]
MVNSLLNFIKELFCLIEEIAPIAIAIFAGRIAYQQYQVQRYKVKLDLFERRMKIYENIRSVLINVFHYASLEKADMNNFHMCVRHSKFLFDKPTRDYIFEIEDKVLEFQRIQMFLFGPGSLPEGETRTLKAVLQEEIMMWLINQITVFDEKFSNFMAINKI